MLITPLANLMPSLTCAFLRCRMLVLLHKPTESFSKASQQDSCLPTITHHFFPGESSSCFVCLRDIARSAGPMPGEKKTSKGRKLCSLTGSGRETEVLVIWGVPLWKVLALFKMCAFSVYLYIIHTAGMKKNGSDFPLRKPFLKNTICYFKSKKDWWQQLWNIICVSMNYLD